MNFVNFQRYNCFNLIDDWLPSFVYCKRFSMSVYGIYRQMQELSSFHTGGDNFMNSDLIIHICIEPLSTASRLHKFENIVERLQNTHIPILHQYTILLLKTLKLICTVPGWLVATTNANISARTWTSIQRTIRCHKSQPGSGAFSEVHTGQS